MHYPWLSDMRPRLQLRRPGMSYKVPFQSLACANGEPDRWQVYIHTACTAGCPASAQDMVKHLLGACLAPKSTMSVEPLLCCRDQARFHADGSGVPGQVLTRHLYAWCLRTRVQQYIQHPWYTTVSFKPLPYSGLEPGCTAAVPVSRV
jgi:hypothetical protein